MTFRWYNCDMHYWKWPNCSGTMSHPSLWMIHVYNIIWCYLDQHTTVTVRVSKPPWKPWKQALKHTVCKALLLIVTYTASYFTHGLDTSIGNRHNLLGNTQNTGCVQFGNLLWDVSGALDTGCFFPVHLIDRSLNVHRMMVKHRLMLAMFT